MFALLVAIRVFDLPGRRSTWWSIHSVLIVLKIVLDSFIGLLNVYLTKAVSFLSPP